MLITMRVPDHPATLNAALEGLVRVNVGQLIALGVQGIRLPTLYTSGIRYGEEPPGREWWQTVADNFSELEKYKGTKKKSTTDCEDLAGHRAAELRCLPLWLCAEQELPDVAAALASGELAGIPARAVCIRTGKRVYHAVVKWPDGSIEDPSRRLGMKPPRARKGAPWQSPLVSTST
jgi:hypothetical protein